MREKLEKISNFLVSLAAGFASFTFTLIAVLAVTDFNEKLAASLIMGLFALLIVWVASEQPNSSQTRAVSALIKRLLAVGTGDLSSPTPLAVRREMPALAAAVDNLFEQVRSNLDNVHAIALYDPVTSLPNRVHFKREAERVLKARGWEEGIALLFIDLDGFKEVNDSLGHAQGDQVLMMVANRLRLVVKSETPDDSLVPPLLARLAGDEFTLLFQRVREPAEAERIAQGALAALCEPFEVGGQTIDIGASIGVALSPRHGTDLAALMKAADVAMYHAKESGRARASMFHPRMAAAFEEKVQTEKALRDALGRGEFELAFQPQLNARTGEVVAGEALIRWNHPYDGLRLPSSFIGIAEESSLIVDIGDWVIDGVAATAARWHAQGMRHRLTFNVSPKQIERADFFTRLRAVVARHQAPLGMLELEITETLVMKCGERVIAELAALRAEGLSIAIDDFGSGYSNLARLKDMPLDRVKLDRSLTADVDRSEGALAIVTAVIHLIHGVGCDVVGEGVERREQLDLLRAVGCDVVQGFAFSEALAEPEFLDWVRDSASQQMLPRRA